MIFFLGLGDIVAAFCLIGLCVESDLPKEMILFFSFYLILKASIFLKDIGSMMDIFAGILLFLGLFFRLPCPILLFAAFLVGFKGFLSLLSLASRV